MNATGTIAASDTDVVVEVLIDIHKPLCQEEGQGYQVITQIFHNYN